jgi:hypothetical protein
MKWSLARGGVFVALGLIAAVGAFAQSSAPAIKLVDCLKDSQALKCQRPGDPGSVGEGLPFAQGGLADAIVGGFVQGNTFIAAAKFDGFGAIIAVNLETGNRELIAGKVNINESKGTALKYAASPGAKEIKEAYTLDGINDVKPLQSGHYLALVRRSIYRVELIDIDPKTGNRSLYWASELAEDTHAAGLRDKEQMKTSNRCTERGVNNRNTNPTSYSMAIDAKGDVYMQFNNNPMGIGYGFVRIRAGKCEDFSTYDLDLNDEIGSGYKTPREEVNYMIAEGSTVYTVSYFADTGHLLALNLENGARGLVSHKDSSAGKSKGKGSVGVGTSGIAKNAEGFWTTKEVSEAVKVIFVDPKSGDRTLVAQNAGVLTKIRDANVQRAFAIPGSNLVLISTGASLNVLDPKTGNSNILSY